jgi:hypothetical protein
VHRRHQRHRCPLHRQHQCQRRQRSIVDTSRRQRWCKTRRRRCRQIWAPCVAKREARQPAVASARSTAAAPPGDRVQLASAGQAGQSETQQAPRAPPLPLARTPSAELLEQALALSMSPAHSNSEGDGAGVASAAANAPAAPGDRMQLSSA